MGEWGGVGDITGSDRGTLPFRRNVENDKLGER